MYNELRRFSEGAIIFAKKKLYVKEQLDEIQVILAWSGHYDYPCKKAVMQPFSGQLFG